MSRYVLRRLRYDAGTAFRRQKAQDALHRRVIDPVEDFTPLLVLKHKPGIDQRRQMMRKCGRRKSQIVADIAEPKACIPGLHQKPKDRQAGVMAKGGKGAGMGAGRAHATKITAIPVL